MATGRKKEKKREELLAKESLCKQKREEEEEAFLPFLSLHLSLREQQSEPLSCVWRESLPSVDIIPRKGCGKGRRLLQNAWMCWNEEAWVGGWRKGERISRKRRWRGIIIPLLILITKGQRLREKL